MAKHQSFYRDAFRIAVQSILEHKLRAMLTLIGIIIGVAAVVVVGASISGLKTYVVDTASKILGANHFMVTRMAFAGRMSDEEYERANRLNKDIQWDEYEFVKANCVSCAVIGAQLNSGVNLEQDGLELPSTRLLGITETMSDIEDKKFSEGRPMSSSEVTHASNVCVIGNDVKERFFPAGSPIGKKLKIRGVPFEIIGVEEPRGSFFGDSQDRIVYIPITVYTQMFGRQGLQIHGGAPDKPTLDAAIDEARLLLRNRRGLVGNDYDTFSVMNADDISKSMDQFTGAIAAVIIPVTLIILVVGGIVVMNIMLVSVTERTFEVGLRKALGATRNQIMMQFLIESALLCSVGGLMGLALSVFATELLTWLLGITMTITFGYIVLSVGVSSSIGIIAGLYPAWKASRLDPIIALTQS